MAANDLIFFEFGPGPCMMATEVYSCTGMTETQLEDMAYQLAIEQAESYGPFYHEGDGPSEEELEELNDFFTDTDLDYRFEPYDPEKHDQLRVGGGSFLDQFKD